MHFLNTIKKEFLSANKDSKIISDLKKQLEAFIKSELKPHYSEKYIQRYKKLRFFINYPIGIYTYNNVTTTVEKNISQEDMDRVYNEGITEVCSMIDEIINNFDELKEPKVASIGGDYVQGHKVNGDLTYGHKVGGDIVYGDKVGGNKELNELKEKLNEGIEDTELKTELIGIVNEIIENQHDDEKKKSLATKLWSKGVQALTILAPYAPYLFG